MSPCGGPLLRASGQSGPWVLQLCHVTHLERGTALASVPPEPSQLLGDRTELAAPHESLSHTSPDPGQGWQTQLGPSKVWLAPASDPYIPFPGPEQPQPV